MNTICQNGRIILNDMLTNMFVSQLLTCTVVRIKTFNDPEGITVRMKNARYSLSCDNPLSGIPGRSDFFEDIDKAIIK